MRVIVISIFALLLNLFSYGQESIYTKEGRSVLNRRQVILNCLKSLKKNRSDKIALAICECQVQAIDRRFTAKQFKQHTRANVIDINGLIKEDSLVEKEIQSCYTGSGRTVLLQAEGFESDFLSNCISAIQNASRKSLDSNRVRSFCHCQLQWVKTRKLNDAEVNTLINPNSVLHFEMMYKCGNPFTGKEAVERNWTPNSAADVKGAKTDTINVLTLNGMTYVKVKLGSKIQVWLLDTGASDLLINTEMEKELKKEKILTEDNYLGTAEYEMANGTVDICRRYNVNNIQIGGFTVDNVLVCVSDKGKRIIVGKALLNKFGNWSLNNEQNRLILSK
jgi:predicted aspartyl protease